MTPAERKRASRAAMAERGESRRPYDLTAANAAKAERVAAARGISPTAAVNEMVSEAPE